MTALPSSTVDGKVEVSKVAIVTVRHTASSHNASLVGSMGSQLPANTALPEVVSLVGLVSLKNPFSFSKGSSISYNVFPLNRLQNPCSLSVAFWLFPLESRSACYTLLLHQRTLIFSCYKQI